MTQFRDFMNDEVHDFPEHERPAVIGSPATPAHGPAVRMAHISVAVLVGTTAGLGSALVSVNALQLQQTLGLSAHQAAWLSTSYVATAASANLLLIKARQQYGLRRFVLIALGLYAAVAVAHLFVTDFGATVLLRAIGGFVSVALIPLCLFHMMQAFPAKWRLRGLVLGIGVTQCAVPLARVVSPSLLGVDGWRSLFLFEAGLVLLSLAAVGLLRLPPAERGRVFEPLDLLTFVMLGGALTLIAVVLGLGRVEGWLHARWILLSLLFAIPALLMAGVVETRRTAPLINLRWLARGDIARFAVAVFMARIVLAEQDVAVAAVRSLGGTTHQLSLLSMVMFGGAVAGVLTSAACVNAEKVARPMMLAIGIVAIAALVDSASTGVHHLSRFYASQAAIAFAATYFLGPALLLGITSALRHGSGELISFIVLFGVVNALGALAGPALLGSYMDWNLATGVGEHAARSNTLQLAAALAALTTLYLAILLAFRIRRKLAELPHRHGVNPMVEPIAPSVQSAWIPPRPGRSLRMTLGTLAIIGIMLVLAAWGLL